MSEKRIRPDFLLAVFLAVLFLLVAGVMWYPGTLSAFSRAGETNIFLRPYLQFMGIISAVNAVLILALVPIFRCIPGVFARLSLYGVAILSTLIVAELGAFVLTKELFNVEHVGSRYTKSFIYSPSLGFVPKPNFRYPLAEGEVTHTGDGLRGPEAAADGAKPRKTFLMIGGSSTYDLGLPDDQTWPANLGEMFAGQIRVLNLGIPGHSTAEHITQTSLSAWKYRPNAVVFYIGWNDIRSSHVDESTDYSRFHKRRMMENFAISEPTSFFALGYIFKKVLARLDATSLHNLSAVATAPGEDGSVDDKLLQIYRHNVRTLAAITRAMGATPIFVPQILNEHQLTSDRPYGWIPRVPQKAVPKIMAVFNEAMMETAREAGATVITEVLDVDWRDADFVDKGHFSQVGARRFACALGAGLMTRKVIDPALVATAALDRNCSPPVRGG